MGRELNVGFSSRSVRQRTVRNRPSLRRLSATETGWEADDLVLVLHEAKADVSPQGHVWRLTTLVFDVSPPCPTPKKADIRQLRRTPATVGSKVRDAQFAFHHCGGKAVYQSPRWERDWANEYPLSSAFCRF